MHGSNRDGHVKVLSREIGTFLVRRQQRSWYSYEQRSSQLVGGTQQGAAGLQIPAPSRLRRLGNINTVGRERDRNGFDVNTTTTATISPNGRLISLHPTLLLALLPDVQVSGVGQHLPLHG